jgi:hypothetical protein
MRVLRALITGSFAIALAGCGANSSNTTSSAAASANSDNAAAMSNVANKTGSRANFFPNQVTITFHFSNRETRKYKAANNTTNPNGDVCTIGSHAPCPAGRWFLNPPNLVQPGTEHYHRVGPAFFQIGSPGTIPYQRDVGLHAGTNDYRDLTYGCIRMTNHDLDDLLDYLKNAGLLVESLEIPGTASCSEGAFAMQAPSSGEFAADAQAAQARRIGIDYARASHTAAGLDNKGLEQMFKVTPALDGAAAEEHSQTLYALLTKFRDHAYAAVLARESPNVRSEVVRALDFFTKTEMTLNKSERDWRKQFPATASAARRGSY